MNVRTILRTFLLGLLFMSSVGLQLITYAQPQLPFQISEDDLKKAEQEIEAFRTSLSPDERAKFDSDVAELTKALESMSEKELEEFFTQLAAMEEAPPAPEPTKAEPVVKTEPTKPSQPVQPFKPDARPAEQLIDDLVYRIDSFLLKVKTVADFDGKIVNWQESEKIAPFETTITWSALRASIETFKQKLIKLKDKDPKTKEFRYIADLMADKALYQKLYDLGGSFNTYEPNIIITGTPGPIELTKATSHAIQKFIDTLNRAIYTDKLGDGIDKIFEKYEPSAKKIKETEEKKDQQALEASKRQRMPESAKIVGKPQPESRFAPVQEIATKGGGTTGYIPNTATPSRGPLYPEVAQTNTAPAPSAGGNTPSAGVSGSGTPYSTGGAPQEGDSAKNKSEEPKAVTTQQTGGQQNKKEEDKKKEEKSLKAIEKVFADVKRLFEDKVMTIISGDSKIKGIEEFIGKSTDVDTGLVKRLSMMATDIQALKSKLERLDSGFKKITDASLKKDAQDEVKELYNEHVKLLTNFVNQLRSLEGKDVSADMRYGYFADKNAHASDEVKSAISEPVNLGAMKKDLEEVAGMMQRLSK